MCGFTTARWSTTAPVLGLDGHNLVLCSAFHRFRRQPCRSTFCYIIADALPDPCLLRISFMFSLRMSSLSHPLFATYEHNVSIYDFWNVFSPCTEWRIPTPRREPNQRAIEPGSGVLEVDTLILGRNNRSKPPSASGTGTRDGGRRVRLLSD